MSLQIDAQIGVGDVTVQLHFHHFLRHIANSHDDAREAYKFKQCDYTCAQAHKLQKHKMTHTGEKAHIPSLPYTRTKIKYTNEDAHIVEVLQIQPVRLHLHLRR